MAIKFKELRKYISRVCRLSICFEDGHYDNYHLISDIPDGKYDDLYVYGIGLVDVEFPLDVYKPYEEEPINSKECFLGHALEIVLYKEDRGFERKELDALQFGDLRKYLQGGRFFSIIIKGEWKSERYEWRKEIQQEYNEMKVYGIGIEDNWEFIKATNAIFEDSHASKRLVIVLE